MEKLTIHSDISAFALEIQPTGSRFICNPAPTDTDEDYVVLANGSWNSFYVHELLLGFGYKYDGSDQEEYEGMGDYDDNGGFMSFKKGEIKYIITADRDFYNSFVTATLVAKAKNILDKGERIKLFRKYLYNEDYVLLETI